MLYTKGADSMILERMSRDPQVNPHQMVDETKKHLEQYVNDGLRTLLVAYREIPDNEYYKWKEQMHRAETTAGAEEKYANRMLAMDEIEVELKLIGATAIEDKLQDGVGPAIASLREADIKVWMLTGDKVGTAVNIAFSCQLITTEMDMLRCVAMEDMATVKDENGVVVESDLGEDNCDKKTKIPKLDAMKTHLKNLVAHAKEVATSNSPKETCLVVDRYALYAIEAALDKPEYKDIIESFRDLAGYVKSLICARVSPKQKARIVDMMRKFDSTKVTLSIGDGANDVPMIQTAHIGVGIFGLEGRQAVNSSDYAIGQFRFLKNLLLIHGRWNLRRASILTCYLYYKNVLLVVPQWYYGFYSLMSGQNFYFDLIYQFYNAAFTFLPCLFFAVLDQDVSSKIAEKYPQLYRDGPQHVTITHTVFWKWIVEGVVHSAMIFFACVGTMGSGVLFEEGKTTGMWALGIVVLWNVCTVAHLRLAVEVAHWNWFIAVGFALSFIGFWGFWWFCSTLYSGYYLNFQQVWGNFTWLSGSGIFWASTFLACTCCLVSMLLVEMVVHYFYPTRAMIGREINAGYIDGKFTPRAGERDSENMDTDSQPSRSPTIDVEMRRFPPDDLLKNQQK